MQPLDVDSRDLFGQRIRPVVSAPNQLLAALHWECTKQYGKRIQISLTHAAETAEAEKFETSLAQPTLGHGGNHLQPTGPVLDAI
jgi:hypothetical protein